MPEGANPDDNFVDYVMGRLDGEPKTPEWAAQICGINANRIRRLAREIARTPRVALHTAWSPARTHNTDSWPQMFMTLGAMTGNIGKSGCMTGVSCWEKTADGGPFLVGSGGGGVPRLEDLPEQVATRVSTTTSCGTPY
jgi:anaerobic dimethyl sulfoxide reductase subunit A